ncbi:hypothetical protein GWI33_016804 [Rhynchophorus ferrugineus]|uniref:TRASH domain-containing protein n=1 Tax=Rhynchophorus ferrugineus TaxID=354439 RepID=A0A834HXW6_RHYFE|nr:hypothetical protein GWI33_016804 [Rhynchophorus ferrugineus]
MEVDSIDSTMDNSASITNNTINNESVNINADDFDENKDVNTDGREGLKNQEVTPPNIESNIGNCLPPEASASVEPLHNSNIDTHLVSNLNVIENQNNENLERDNELMETESSEASSLQIVTLQPGTSEEQLSENISKSDNVSKTQSGAVESVDISSESVCDSFDVNEGPLEEHSILESKQSSDLKSDRSVDKMDSAHDTLDNVQVVSGNINEVEHNQSTTVKTSNQELSEISVSLNDSEKCSGENEMEITSVLSDDNNEKCKEADSSLEAPTVSDKDKSASTEDVRERDFSEKVSKDKQNISDESICDQRIEFAQVNFDTNMESEKGNDKGLNKGNELDPIASASDVLVSLENSQGADEEITIIPDSEREITEAEKEAASSLPTLKDISDKTKLSNPTIDESFTESEVKMYNYEKDDLKKCCECNLEKATKYHFSNQDQQVTYICDDNCLNSFKNNISKKVTMVADEGGGLRVKNFVEGPLEESPSLSFVRKCASCNKVTDDIETNLTWEIMDFCDELCLSKYQKMIGSKCASCAGDVKSTSLGKYCVRFGNDIRQFCTSTCLEQYKKGLKVCSYCQQDMSNGPDGFLAPVGEKGQFKDFCSKICMEKYDIMTNDRPPNVESGTICYVCKTEKLITIEFEHDGVPNYFCGKLQKTKKFALTVDNATSTINETQLPVISSVQSLATTNGTTTPPLLPPGLTPITSTRLTRSKSTTSGSAQQTPVQSVQNIELPVQVQVKQHYIIKERPSVEQRNVAVMCTPRKAVRATQVTPTMVDVGIQTDREEIKKILIPVPVPIYVPSPCHMFAAPVPFPVPFPLPIPIPIFIPTTRNSAAGIMKEIKKIQVKIPTDPYEAELLMMAEMVAEEKKEENTDSESDLDDNTADNGGEYSPEPVDASNTFGDDMLQMALKMATELDEPAVDLEGALTANTITAPQGGHPDGHAQEESVDDPQPMHHHMMERSPLRGRKRGMRSTPRGGQSKRGRRMSHHQVDMPMMQQVQPAPPPEPQEKPDANMCLKYTFGVNAWKQWVTTKNAELEKSSRLVKLFKTEILQLTADELNYSLCLFVKEVRKPNGQEYAPDTIYYLCLGIQQYLFENGRIDNIFCDVYYEKFTDCLDEVAKKFSVLYNDSQYIVTRVEEEHLWESKQLGAHSPHVLLSTLMFFNTKHFNLTSVDEHMQLSFSHIMKHWKRNPNQPGASKVPGSRNVLLRFYPPQSAIQNNQRKKKVYEQQENEENPLRCPVKLYEFYLSKCPESVKTRNDVFYLQPERSCVPDSPVWYSTMPLPKEALEKMLHRVKMVKEINVALLTS